MFRYLENLAMLFSLSLYHNNTDILPNSIYVCVHMFAYDGSVHLCKLVLMYVHYQLPLMRGFIIKQFDLHVPV